MNEIIVPTSLEQSILSWFAQKYNDKAIGRQIKSAKIVDRKWTKVGFFLELEVDKGVLAESDGSAKLPSVLSGPAIRSSGIEYGGGSIIFLKENVVTTLELYSNGDRFDEVIVEFELEESEI